MFHDAWVGRGMAIGDINNDSRMDPVVSTNGGAPHVLLNLTQTANHWTTRKRIGHKSNRDGIGARVKVTTSSGSQWDTVTTSSGYMSASDPRLHFGLGPADAIDRIEIRWPSGIQQVLVKQTPDHQITIEEPAVSQSSRPVATPDKPMP